MKQYDNYKNSGVEWLGDIPEHWEVKRFKHITNIQKGKLPKKIVSINELNLPPYMSMEYLRGGEENQWVFDKDAKIIDENKTLLLWDGSNAGEFIKSRKGVISSTVAEIEFKNIEENFAWFYSKFLEIELRKKTIGMGIPHVNGAELKNFSVVIPPKEEQTAIANFLDNKTTKIDQAIAIKQQQIALLQERRQILIHKAVTRGLNENVKLKDSGVEWIGEIPEHWEVKKLFGLCNFIRGNSTFSKDELLCNGDYVALQYGKTYKVDEINDDYSFYVNEEFYKETQIVKYDDTILISTSETIEDLGHSAYYKRNDIGLIGGEQILLNPNNKKINGHYLYFYSKLFSKELRKYATGIKVYRFNVNNLKTIYTAIPPLSEQKQIVEFIETATAKIATAISLKEQEIEKLKEYKMSLIDGVVTGKVRVIS